MMIEFCWENLKRWEWYGVVIKTGYLEKGAQSVNKIPKKSCKYTLGNVPVCTSHPCKENK